MSPDSDPDLDQIQSKDVLGEEVRELQLPSMEDFNDSIEEAVEDSLEHLTRAAVKKKAKSSQT